MTFSRAILVWQFASFLAFSQAWTTPRQVSERGLASRLLMAEGEQSFDGVQLTTKSNKQIVFDDNKGRFFETSLEPEVPYSAVIISPSSSYEIPADVAMSRTYLGNKMMLTSVLFGRKPKLVETDIDEVPKLVAALEAAEAQPKEMSSPSPPPTESIVPSPVTTSIVEQCYAAWNNRDMAAVAECFDDRLEYQDSQFLGTMNTKAALKQHFENQAKLLPPNSEVVLENIAVDPTNGNIGTQWYVQVGSSKVPFTKGCSFYQINPETGLIKSGFRVSEMIVKPSKQAVDLLVSSASRLSRQSTPPQETETTTSPAANSIIEEYFNAWNGRDMESALDCFVEDCTYQTEDPVFVDTFRGKAALRAHLEKNAASLPSSCRILLDSTAVDPIRGTIGTQWHLEVNGIAIPNLRGCSMYTTDAGSGLLKSGYDVTEAPVKVPRQFLAATQLLSLPARALFGRQQ